MLPRLLPGEAQQRQPRQDRRVGQVHRPGRDRGPERRQQGRGAPLGGGQGIGHRPGAGTDQPTAEAGERRDVGGLLDVDGPGAAAHVHQDRARIGQHDVGGGQGAVRQARPVQRGERCRDRDEDADGFGVVERAAGRHEDRQVHPRLG